MRGRGIIAAGTILAASWVASATCGEHLVDARAAQAAVQRVAADRAADVAAIQGALRTSVAERAARAMGVPLDRVVSAVPTLSDGEVHDLAVRAAALQGDPLAGQMDPWVNEVLVVILIVGIVVLVLSAV